MENNKPYDPAEMAGKFICCFMAVSGTDPAINCVRYDGGARDGRPYLYDSRRAAIEDENFSEMEDAVVPADMFFRLLSDDNQ